MFPACRDCAPRIVSPSRFEETGSSAPIGCWEQQTR